MPERVLDQIGCPRCGASAKVWALEAEGGTDAMMIQIRCSKCKLERTSGFTTRKAILVEQRRIQLEAAYDLADDPYQRAEIYELLQRLGKRERLLELGLSPQ